MDKEIYHEYTGTLICPYCGYDNGRDDLNFGVSEKRECEECEKEFNYEAELVVEISTRKMCCSAPDKHDWEDFSPGHNLKKCKICDKYEANRKING